MIRDVSAFLLVLIITCLVIVWVRDQPEPKHVTARRTCLEHGYPKYEASGGMLSNKQQSFCVRRVNGTDEVVNVNELMRQP